MSMSLVQSLVYIIPFCSVFARTNTCNSFEGVIKVSYTLEAAFIGDLRDGKLGFGQHFACLVKSIDTQIVVKAHGEQAIEHF